MAHNQDRLQNSDSSVVYGHGHIIYSHTARTGRQQAVQAGDAQAPRRLAAAFSEAIASHSLTWATHHYDKPSNSQLWVWMALLKNTSQSISPSPLALRERNVHFCIDFSSNKPNIHQFVSEHWIWCFFCISWPENDRLENLFFGGQASKWLMILSFKIRFLF